MESANEKEVPGGWRLRLGIGMFVVSLGLPLLGVPLVATLEISSTAMATASGAILACGELLGIAAVAVMGKSGYEFIKSRFLAFLGKYGPPDEVGLIRYRVGLVMFTIPILFAWISPYAGGFILGFQGNEIVFAVIGDLMLLASLFVLGGDFWDKLRSLFMRRAKANIPTGVTS